jgi:hypothetical protein
MGSLDFDKVWFKKLEMTDDLTSFHCDKDDDSGCCDFIHKPEEAKEYQKERHGIYLFFEETMVGYVVAMSSISAERLEDGDEEIRLRFYPCLLVDLQFCVGAIKILEHMCKWATGLALESSEKISL